jgi:FkbM family methyltransferase
VRLISLSELRHGLARRLHLTQRDAGSNHEVVKSRTSLIGNIIRGSDPDAYFKVILNGSQVWLPRDTVRTMVHCLKVRPKDGALVVHVETGHLAWMMKHLQAGGTFLDVGAATGATTIPIALRLGHSVTVIAYEPAARTRRLLRDTLARNNVAGVEVRPVAVSDAPGEAEFFEMPFDDTDRAPYLPEAASLFTPSVAAASVTRHVVPVTSMDVETATRPLKGPVVVKIDVEGFEVHVLRGATRLITEYRPFLSIDIHGAPFGKGETTEEDCRALLKGFGYEFEKMEHVLLCSPGRDS